MKDQLIEILMRLFDSSLNELAQHPHNEEMDNMSLRAEFIGIKEPSSQSYRVFTDEERVMMTRASQQLLVRLLQMNIISHDQFELVLEHLQMDHVHLIGLSETKWTVRKILTQFLNDYQLAFLDLVLYQKEYDITAH